MCQFTMKLEFYFHIAALILDTVPVHETAITVNWISSFNCCIAKYSISINDTTLVIPGYKQGYNFVGLKDNTCYLITLVASYCNNASNTAARSICTCKWVKPCSVLKMCIY